MDESTFILLADTVLSTLSDEVSSRYGAFSDVDYDDGVMTIQLPSEAEYVINRHTPSRQIWMSSPVSGPSYYVFDMKSEKWYNNKDLSLTLTQTLLEELEQIQKDQA